MYIIGIVKQERFIEGKVYGRYERLKSYRKPNAGIRIWNKNNKKGFIFLSYSSIKKVYKIKKLSDKKPQRTKQKKTQLSDSNRGKKKISTNRNKKKIRLKKLTPQLIQVIKRNIGDLRKEGSYTVWRAERTSVKAKHQVYKKLHLLHWKEAMLRLSRPDIAPYTKKFLLKELVNGNKKSRIRAAILLTRQNQSEGIKVLIEALNNKEWVYLAAIELIHTKNKQAFAAIIRKMETADSDVIEAFGSEHMYITPFLLSTIDTKRATRKLLSLLLKSKLRERFYIVASLGNLRAKSALKPLILIAYRKGFKVQKMIALSLSKIGGQQAIKQLFKYFNRSSQKKEKKQTFYKFNQKIKGYNLVRKAALYGLKQLGQDPYKILEQLHSLMYDIPLIISRSEHRLPGYSPSKAQLAKVKTIEQDLIQKVKQHPDFNVVPHIMPHLELINGNPPHPKVKRIMMKILSAAKKQNNK